MPAIDRLPEASSRTSVPPLSSLVIVSFTSA